MIENTRSILNILYKISANDKNIYVLHNIISNKIPFFKNDFNSIIWKVFIKDKYIYILICFSKKFQIFKKFKGTKVTSAYA